MSGLSWGGVRVLGIVGKERAKEIRGGVAVAGGGVSEDSCRGRNN